MKSVAVSIGWLVKPMIAPVCDGVGVGIGDDDIGVDSAAVVGLEPGLGVAVAVDVGFAVGIGCGPLLAPCVACEVFEGSCVSDVDVVA